MKCNKLRLAVLVSGIISFATWARPGLEASVSIVFDRDNSTTFMTSFPNSQAAFTLFTSALSSYAIDTVETAAGINPTLTFGGAGITATANGVLAQNAPGLQIGTQALLEVDAAGFPQVNSAFVFDRYINAFGAFVVQGGDAGNDNPTTFRLSDTATSSFVDVPIQIGPGWGFDNVFFVGLIDSSATFNKVEIMETGDLADGMLYDNIVAGVAGIPEPGSLLVWTLVVSCVVGWAGRRRRA